MITSVPHGPYDGGHQTATLLPPPYACQVLVLSAACPWPAAHAPAAINKPHTTSAEYPGHNKQYTCCHSNTCGHPGHMGRSAARDHVQYSHMCITPRFSRMWCRWQHCHTFKQHNYDDDHSSRRTPHSSPLCAALRASPRSTLSVPSG